MLREDLKNDFDALLPGRTDAAGPTRRTALKAALGVGYTAAAGTLMAQTAVKTPADGLTVGEVSYEVNGFKVPAYRAAPAGRTGLPVVLVIQEIFGVHEYIADTARRFAKAGYLAIAPELYARQGDPTSYGEVGKLMSEIVSKVPDAQVMADLADAVAGVEGAPRLDRLRQYFNHPGFVEPMVDATLAALAELDEDLRHDARALELGGGTLVVTVLPQRPDACAGCLDHDLGDVCGQQRAGVGVPGVVQHLARRAFLDGRAVAQDRDAIADGPELVEARARVEAEDRAEDDLQRQVLEAVVGDHRLVARPALDLALGDVADQAVEHADQLAGLDVLDAPGAAVHEDLQLAAQDLGPALRLLEPHLALEERVDHGGERVEFPGT